MLSSKKIQKLQKYFDLVEKNKGKTIGEVYKKITGGKHSHFKKGASGLIIENLFGLKNNSSPKADLEEINVEIKVLPIQLHNLKVKEPTAIKMINFMEVVEETWETSKIKDKIETIFWVVYGVPSEKKEGEKRKNLSQENYILLDYFLDHPDFSKKEIFKKDWELIQSYIIKGNADNLSCSMGEYIEPKTKGKNNLDKTNAPDGKGGILKVRRRAFYFKKKYTNENIVPELDLKEFKNDK